MEIITTTAGLALPVETAVAVGKFDGIHIGHRKLLEEIRKQKPGGLSACVFTFHPSPSVFFGQGDGKELTTRAEKRIFLERLGVDFLIEFPLTRDTAWISPEDFVREILVRQLRIRFLAAGTDLSFGAGGAGNAELIRKMAPEGGFRAKIIEKVCLQGTEVTSSYIRSLVEDGKMELAGRMLGTPYTIAGEVRHGMRLGRTLGFPTVNLLPERMKLLPPRGVYFSAVYHEGKRYRAISNVGYKPTVAERAENGMPSPGERPVREKVPGVESYLYDFSGEIYGAAVEVRLESFLRPERKFVCVEALRAQMEKDIEAGRGRDQNA